MKITVDDWLADWFVARGKIKANAPPNQRETFLNIDYFEAGWLTSMEVVELVTEIEGEFGVQFSDRDLQDPRLATIAGLRELIAECSTRAGESG